MFAGFLLTLMLASPPDAQPGEVLFEEGRNYFISGDFSDLVEVKGTIYAASGFGLTIVPADLSTQEHIPTPHYSRKIALAGKQVYLGEGNRITEFKISTRGTQMLTAYPVEGKVTALAARKDLLAGGTDSAKIVIFSQGKESKLLGAIDAPGAVQDLFIYHEFLYAACGRGGVAIIELGENPSIVRTLDVPGAQALTVAEDLLFVATAAADILSFSLADPSSPHQKKGFSSGSEVVSLAYYDKHLYAAQGYQGYSIFDLEGERVETAEPFRQGDVTCILPTKEGVFLALRERGMVRLEGSMPQELSVTARLQQNSPSVHTSQSGAFWAVARDRDGASIGRLLEGEECVTWGHAEPAPKRAAGVLLSGTYLYVADADRGASIFNLKTFPFAERKFDLNQPGTPQRFALSGDLIFLAAGDRGLRVLWICSCGPLQQRVALQGIKAVDVAAKDSIVYVADPDSGLRVMAVRNKNQEIHELSIYPGAISPQALLRRDDVLYVADSIGAIVALDISEAKNPRQLSFAFIETQPYGMALVDSTLYVACGEDGVLPIDVSDPSSPVVGEFIETPGKALAVAASGKYLGVADYTSWMLIPVD